jgi:GMP synthase (glutamine-hydrolysing)
LSQIRANAASAACYGAQYMHFSGGEVVLPPREYGRAEFVFYQKNEMKCSFTALRHNRKSAEPFDTIKTLPTNGVKLASTHDEKNAAYRIEGETTYAISPLKCNYSHRI